MATIVDGLKYQQALRASGVDAEQATKLAEALSAAVSADALATKADLAELKTSIVLWVVGSQAALLAAMTAIVIKLTGH